MNLFRSFMKLAWKHKTIIIAYLAIYFAFGFLMSAATGFEPDFEEEEQMIMLTVEDPKDAETDLYKALEDYLAELNYKPFDVEGYGTTAEELLEMQLIEAEIKVRPGIEANLKNGEELFEISYATQNMHTYKLMYELYSFGMFAGGVAGEDGTFTAADEPRFKEIMATEGEMHLLRPDTKDATSKGMSFFKYFFPYNFSICLIFLLGYVLYDFESPQLKRRIKLGAVTNTRWNLEILLGQFVLFIIMLGLGVTMSWMSADDSLALLPRILPNLLCFGFATVTVTNLFIKIFPKGMLAGAALVYTMGSSFMSGAFFPREMLSESVINISKIFPMYYYINDLEQYALPLSERLPNLLAMFLFGILFLVLAILVDRLKSQRATLELDPLFNN